MFALRVCYLTGRVYSAEFEEGDVKQTVEWPPQPSRLFSALVASWGEGGAEPELRVALEWLEQQEPPVIYYGDCSPRTIVNAYVPVNDSRGLETLPDERPRKGRTFPSASLPDPEVWFVWPEPPPAAVERAMQALLRRTPSLGHSASLVSMETGGIVPPHFKRLQPDSTGGMRMRIPSLGRFEILQRSFEEFQRNPAKVHRPNRGKTASYGAPQRADKPVAKGLFRETVVMRLTSGESLYLPATLAVASALRGALMSAGPQPPPEAITGHAPGSTPEQPLPSERPHVALAPLAFTTSRHATGQIFGAAIFLPSTLTDDERIAVLRAADRIRQLQLSFGRWKVERADAEEVRATLRPHTWIRPARLWATVTPYVFDRYPADPYGEEAQETVRISCERVGLPRPASVTLTKTSMHVGVPPAGRFPAAIARDGKPKRFHLHVFLAFDRPVPGPMVIGAGRYYGYGLFRPTAEERWN